jgi:hypothetical protein
LVFSLSFSCFLSSNSEENRTQYVCLGKNSS